MQRRSVLLNHHGVSNGLMEAAFYRIPFESLLGYIFDVEVDVICFILVRVILGGIQGLK